MFKSQPQIKRRQLTGWLSALALHDAYYAGAWSLLNLPADAASVGIPAIECNDFMLPPPRFSRVRRPLLSLAPGAPGELMALQSGDVTQAVCSSC